MKAFIFHHDFYVLFWFILSSILSSSGGLFGPPNRSKTAAKINQNLLMPTCPQETTPRGPKTAPRDPQTLPRGSKIAPRGSQEPPKRPSERPRASKDPPKRPKNTPRGPTRSHLSSQYSVVQVGSTIFNSSYNYVLEVLKKPSKTSKNFPRPTYWSLRTSKPPYL